MNGPAAVSPGAAAVPRFRGLLLFLILDIVCPYLTYQYVLGHVTGVSQTQALLLSGVFPAAANLISIIRSRSLDIIGTMVLLGILVGAASAALGGGPRLVLVRESFVTGALALVCLVSLWAPRPLLFYIGRDFSTGHDPARIAQFNALWELPAARHVFRVMTAVWGVGWLVEVSLKVFIVFTLPIPRALVVGPIETSAITAGLIVWTIRYVAAARRRGESRRVGGA